MSAAACTATLACLACCAAVAVGCGDEQPSGTRSGTVYRSSLSASNGEDLEHDRDRSAEGVAGRSVCTMLPPRRVEATLRAAGVGGARGLRPERNDSLDLSICRYAHGGVNVRVLLDGAADATRRYYNQLTEAAQKFNPDPSLRPRTMRHVGDDSTYGGAGAYWTRARDQLIAFDNDRIVRITVHVPGQPESRRRAAAAHLARRLFAMLPHEHDG